MLDAIRNNMVTGDIAQNPERINAGRIIPKRKTLLTNFIDSNASHIKFSYHFYIHCKTSVNDFPCNSRAESYTNGFSVHKVCSVKIF